MYRIAQISDLHLDHGRSKEMQIDTRANFIRVLNDIRTKSVDEIVLTGDLAESTAVSWFFEVLEEEKTKYSFIFGNHDERPLFRESTNKEPYYFYYREIAGYKVIFMDSGETVIDENQLRWLIEQLAESGGKVLLFVHHPILDCGTLFMDVQYPLKNRDNVHDILRQSGKEVSIFCGHYHTEDERMIGRVKQYVTPSTYYQIRRDTKNHEIDPLPIGYRLIDIGEVIKSRVIRVV